jgi:hypothetical protein
MEPCKLTFFDYQGYELTPNAIREIFNAILFNTTSKNVAKRASLEELYESNALLRITRQHVSLLLDGDIETTTSHPSHRAVLVPVVMPLA